MNWMTTVQAVLKGYTGMGIGREFAEFRKNVLHSPQGKKLTREKKFPGSFFSRVVKLIFRRSEAPYMPQHRFRFLLCACAVTPLPLWLQAQSVNMSSMSRIVQRGESFRFFYFFQFPCLVTTRAVDFKIDFDCCCLAYNGKPCLRGDAVVGS